MLASMDRVAPEKLAIHQPSMFIPWVKFERDTQMKTPKQEAIANGSKTYIGKPCLYGHDGTRYARNSQCVECIREKSRKYYSENKDVHYSRCRDWLDRNREKSAERERKKYAANPEKYREKTKQWFLNHPEYKWWQRNPWKAKELVKKWQNNNRDIRAAIQIKRHASKLKRTPQWADEGKIREVYMEAKRLTEQTGIRHVVDHYYPLQGRTVSGLHVHQNLRVITQSENCRKSNKCPE